MIEPAQVERIVEAALLAAGEPLSIDRLMGLFDKDELPGEDPRGALHQALHALDAKTQGRAFELARVASGFRLQVREEFGAWVGRLFEQRPPRYSRALLETLALIVYRQPVTRGDIEEVRGVSVSHSIMRTLLEHGWIRAVGQRETPGRPTMYGTTRAFLDYFNLKSLDDLPPLAEIQSLIEPRLSDDATTPPPNETSADGAAPEQAQPEADPRPLAEVVQLPIAER